MNQNGTYNGLDRGVNNGLNSGVDGGVLNGTISGDKPLLFQQPSLLNLYPGAILAFSLRKLNPAYTGPCIRVRRSTDNVELDIGFTIYGDLDTKTLLNFIGKADGFVTTWYEQVGAGGLFGLQDASQTIQANQPRIVSAGVLDKNNSKPALFFDGTNDSLTLLNAPYNVDNIYFFSVCKPNTLLASTRTIYSQRSAGNIRQIYVGFNNVAARQYIVWVSTFTATSSNTNINLNTQLFTMFKTGISANWNYGYFLNGVADGVFTNTTNAATTNPTIGEIGVILNASYLSANLSEIVYYNSDQSSNRTAIESNINNYYKIY